MGPGGATRQHRYEALAHPGCALLPQCLPQGRHDLLLLRPGVPLERTIQLGQQLGKRAGRGQHVTADVLVAAAHHLVHAGRQVGLFLGERPGLSPQRA